jgi:hypothetical protein
LPRHFQEFGSGELVALVAGHIKYQRPITFRFASAPVFFDLMFGTIHFRLQR